MALVNRKIRDFRENAPFRLEVKDGEAAKMTSAALETDSLIDAAPLTSCQLTGRLEGDRAWFL